MSFASVWKQVKDIDGWLGIEDAKVLYDYASDVEGLIVEIGPYAGKSTKLMALASPKSKIVTIDSFNPDNFPGTMTTKEVIKACVENTKGLNVTLLIDSSENVGKIWSRPIDLLHIDGDHKYLPVKTDIDLFVPHVQSQSAVLLHDYLNLGDPEKIIKNRFTRTQDWNAYYNWEYGVVMAVDESRKYFSSVKAEAGFAVCIKK